MRSRGSALARSRTLRLRAVSSQARQERKPEGAYVELLRTERPVTRGDCQGGQRPCPWVSCRYHLYLDAMPNGSLKLNFPDREPWELAETCALDVADEVDANGDEKERTLDEVGDLVNLTRERVRQVEVRALLQLKAAAAEAEEGGDEE